MSAVLDIADRQRAGIKRLMKRRNLKVRPWAERAGVSEGTLRNFLAGRSNSLNSSTLQKLAAAEELNVADLFEDGSARSDSPRLKDVVVVPSVRVTASLGGGRYNEQEEQGPPFYFQRAWVEDGLRINAGELRVFWSRGDSMMPTIGDGDALLIRLKDTDVSASGIFALDEGTGLMVKRLQLTGSKQPRLQIISDNPIYRPYEVPLDGVHVVGRIIWRGGRLG